jgi:hypothetical protein
VVRREVERFEVGDVVFFDGPNLAVEESTISDGLLVGHNEDGSSRFSHALQKFASLLYLPRVHIGEWFVEK